MTCVAVGLLLRVSFELDRAQRQVARLRGDAPAPAPTAHDPAPARATPATHAPAAEAAPLPTYGTSRLRQRVEPTFGRTSA